MTITVDHLGDDMIYHCENCGHHHCKRCGRCHRCGCTDYKGCRGERKSLKFARKMGLPHTIGQEGK